MKALFAAVALLAAVALAGENIYLGRVLSPAGQPTTNLTTLYPFPIPPGAKLTFYCSVATNVLTDSRTVAAVYDGGTVACTANSTGLCNQPYGVPFAATTIYPTSVGMALAPYITLSPVDAGLLADGGVADGGTTTNIITRSAVVAIQPTTSGSGFCDWWQRSGTE